MKIKKADFKIMLDIIKTSKVKKLEVISLMQVLCKAIREPDIKVDDLWKEFKSKCERSE